MTAAKRDVAAARTLNNVRDAIKAAVVSTKAERAARTLKQRQESRAATVNALNDLITALKNPQKFVGIKALQSVLDALKTAQQSRTTALQNLIQATEGYRTQSTTIIDEVEKMTEAKDKATFNKHRDEARRLFSDGIGKHLGHIDAIKVLETAIKSKALEFKDRADDCKEEIQKVKEYIIQSETIEKTKDTIEKHMNKPGLGEAERNKAIPYLNSVGLDVQQTNSGAFEVVIRDYPQKRTQPNIAIVYTNDNCTDDELAKLKAFTKAYESWAGNVGGPQHNFDLLRRNMVAVGEMVVGTARIYVRLNRIPGQTMLTSPPQPDNSGQYVHMYNETYGPFAAVYSESINTQMIFEGDPGTGMSGIKNLVDTLIGTGKEVTHEITNPATGAKQNIKVKDNGRNVNLFGFGVSGSGKTYTIAGHGQDKGLVHMLIEELIKRGNAVRVKKIEEYYGHGYHNNLSREAINTHYPLRKDRKVDYGLSDDDKIINKDQIGITDPDKLNEKMEQINYIMNKINQARISWGHIKTTPNNPQSSRSHLFIDFEVTHVNGTSILSICDMGGLEKVSHVSEQISGIDLSYSVATPDLVASRLAVKEQINPVEAKKVLATVPDFFRRVHKSIIEDTDGYHALHYCRVMYQDANGNPTITDPKEALVKFQQDIPATALSNTMSMLNQDQQWKYFYTYMQEIVAEAFYINESLRHLMNWYVFIKSGRNSQYHQNQPGSSYNENGFYWYPEFRDNGIVHFKYIDPRGSREAFFKMDTNASMNSPGTIIRERGKQAGNIKKTRNDSQDDPIGMIKALSERKRGDGIFAMFAAVRLTSTADAPEKLIEQGNEATLDFAKTIAMGS